MTTPPPTPMMWFLWEDEAQGGGVFHYTSGDLASLPALRGTIVYDVVQSADATTPTVLVEQLLASLRSSAEELSL